MEWLLPHKLLVARINPIEELEEYALRAIEKKEPVGDHKMVSIKREYSMEIPPNFEQWMCDTIDTHFDLHKPQCGIYGRDNGKRLRIIKMWANEMYQGDQHQPHMHQYSLYSFSCYIRTTNNDAPFYFIDNNQGQAVFINADSEGHSLIFPGTLIHTVYPKETEDVRISVSGNVILDVDKT
tara:strand:+ start:191 stop:733 length:543 start_codon:yes stop_codon:yes gene_type:complete